MYRTIGLFSLTEVPDSILMRSYYADSHLGFCLGYNTSALFEHLEQIAERGELLIDKAPVVYFLIYSELNPGELDARQYFLLRTHVKSIEWSHEREWRLVVFKTTDYTTQLPQGIVRQVILGCRTCNEHRKEIVSLAKESLGHDVKFSQVRTKANEFGLELAPLA